jgi:hypothetical protein
VLEVDIKGFFDSLNHGHLRGFLDQRVRDGVLRRAIDKWLKAGVMEGGVLTHPDTGTPQGGVVSPLLANVYLHEVLDRWFETQVRPRLVGRATLIRYADDFVVAFSSEVDAVCWTCSRSDSGSTASRFTRRRRGWRGFAGRRRRMGASELRGLGPSTCSASRITGASRFAGTWWSSARPRRVVFTER